jgi:transcriptional regulator with GAF, ATPase, and Fis domain
VFEMENDSLQDVNRQLGRQQELGALLGLIVEHAVGVTGAQRGFLVLEEHGELRLDDALDRCHGEIAPHELETSSSVVREALSRMESVRVANATCASNGGSIALGRRSILCVPFEVTGDLRGAICVDHHPSKGTFDAHAEHLCRMLADQAALSIRQVKRLEELLALNRELERRVSEKEVDLQDARRALREAGLSEALVIPIAELEKRAIHSALQETGGDKRRAAELLGISRAKIYQRLKDWAQERAGGARDRSRGGAEMVASPRGAGSIALMSPHGRSGSAAPASPSDTG